MTTTLTEAQSPTLTIEPDQIIEPALALTESAQKQVFRVLERKNTPGAFLRIGVRGGGCSGLSYVLKPDTEFDEFDRTWTLENGVRVVVDRKSIQYLAGTTLDYSIKNLLEGGFQFQNPNSAKSCGCGSSFTPK
ncbi:MAG: iron-sulfur cluster assembly protein IscA [Capsulimonas sp.]|jgi:iron-sulfur cluster assembly protein|nr:iron-sulfur cluster assembly protein IscA [Capsulimonas sp.]